MSLSSSSTYEEILASYVDNAAYESSGSVSMAQSFITACRILLVKMPSTTSNDGASVSMKAPDELKREIADARAFINNNSSAGPGQSVSRVSFRGFRS